MMGAYNMLKNVLTMVHQLLFKKANVVQLTIRPVAPEGYGSIAHEAKPNELLTRGP